MFNDRFNNTYQNMNDPNMEHMDGMQQDPYAPYYPEDPYAIYNQDPSMMQNIPYPMPPTETNTAYPQGYSPEGFAKGGKVKKKKETMQNSPYPMLAEMIRQQGNGEDTILAHINPLEAMMLKSMGGSGTINKKTGLPQFGLLSNPGKWFKSVAGGGLGVVLGNMILPGVGGLIGGALGGAAGSAARGRKDHMQAALRGLSMGAMAPTLAGWAGTGLNSIGATGAGGALTQYGNNNAIMPALGKLFGMGSGSEPSILASQAGMPQAVYGAGMSPANLSGAVGQTATGVASAGSNAASGSWFDQLLGNSGKFFSKPKNLLALAAAGSSMLNRPKQEKPKTPEQLANEQKRLEKALMLSPDERAAKEAELTAEARMRRSVERNKFLPTEHFANLDPIHRRSNTPEEQKKSGRWFSYHNNPEFSGEPMAFAEGGSIRTEIVNKAKALTSEIIEQNKNQHEGVLNEKSLIRDFTNLGKTLGLTESEKNAVERYAESIFRDNQFTDGPGYFYNQAHGNPTAKKTGGMIEEMIGIGTPTKSSYIDGIGGGQADNIRTGLPDKSYMIKAATVSDLGDGNSRAGANKIQALISNGEYYISPEDVARFGKLGAERLDSFVKNVDKHKRGSTKMSPKAKPLTSYLKK